MRLWSRRAAGWLLLPAGALLAALVAVPLPPVARPASPVVLDRHGGWMRLQLTADGGGIARIPVFRHELPEGLVQAVLDFEDRRFYHHPGIDPLALARASWLNFRGGRVVSGGSTITMQVARMLERRPRTLASKLVEAFRALQLELRYSKDEILALYFNLAPYGGNIEGVGAAAYYYYGKPVERLSLDEAATLAALPNAPGVLAPRSGRSTEALRKRRNDVLARMAAAGKVSQDAADEAMALPIHAARRDTPFVAPHYAQRVLAEHPERLRIAGTIDQELQQRIEKLLGDHVERLSRHGIHNGAVVLIENATRKVRAYVGSQSFLDAEHQGQVDGAAALRSPGSTLKPFVYALALDRGLIGENTLLEDVPIAYADWAPVNFDGEWRGVVPARIALAQSLNVPAVKLAERLEPDGLVRFLQRAQFRAFGEDAPKRYGLATVLGGTDVNLLELTNLYATLAQGGLHLPPRLVEDAEVGQPQRLLSPGASYLVAEILTDVRRPELPETWRDAVSIPRLAWKTGTSYGRRDAWSIGTNRRWSIGVWIGNFEPRGVPELVGVQAAAPLLLAIAQTLPGADSDPWLERPPEVIEREVCALSGAAPGPDCPHRNHELALAGAAPRDRCRHHVALEIDDQTGERLCSRCRQGRSFHRETHLIWPASVAAYLDRSGFPSSSPPVHSSRCEHGLAGEGPVIRAPLDGDRFVLRDGVPLEHQQIALIASTEGSGALYWFADDALIASGPPGRAVLYPPTQGVHRLVAMDAEGRKTAVTITVQ